MNFGTDISHYVEVTSYGLMSLLWIAKFEPLYVNFHFPHEDQILHRGS